MDQAPSLTQRALQVCGLWAAAVVGPLLHFLGLNGEMFVVRRTEPLDLWLMLAALCLLVPLGVTGLKHVLEGWSRRASLGFHALFGAGLVALIALPSLHQSGLSVALAAASGWVLGLVVMMAGLRYQAVSRFLCLSALGLALFVFSFLSSPTIRTVMAPGSAHQVYPETDSEIPVVVVVLDELPLFSLLDAGGKIDAALFPNFARLARTSTWYRRATTVADCTNAAVPAILTGTYPDESRQPVFGAYPRNLFTLLGQSYDLQVCETMTWLCPPGLQGGEGRQPLGERLRLLTSDLWHIAPQLLVPQESQVGLTWTDLLPQSETAEAPTGYRSKARVFLDYVEGLRRPERPTLFFVHTVLPHIPWSYLPNGQSYATTDAKFIPGMPAYEQWGEDAFLIEQAYQRHLMQAAYVDGLLGRLLDRLEELEVLEESLLVVVADHGASFQVGGGRRLITAENASDILAVPLFVKEPGQRSPRVDDSPAATIDVLPTVADRVGIRLSWPIDGSPLGRLPARPEAVLYDQHHQPHTFDRADLDGKASLDWKLSLFPSGEAAASLFRLGPRPDLVGRELQTVGAPLRFDLEQPERYDDVDPEGAFVPAWVKGQIHGAAGEPLAIGVNGVVQATTWSYRHSDGSVRFSALVQPASFRSGPNRIDVAKLP